MNESATNHAIRRLVDRLLRARDPEAGRVKMGKSTRRDLLRWGTATAGAAALIGGAMGAPTRARLFAQTGHATPEAKATPTTPMTPPSMTETWTEPWIWRPGQWPGQSLDLNIVENENPGAIVGLGNQTAVLFSYGGGTPGPSIRMRGDEVLLVTLRNVLGRNYGQTPLGPYPEPISFELPPNVTLDQVNAKARQLGLMRDNVCLGEHTNGVHSIHDTNLHTHGLHVRPGPNPDGTQSDNIFLRVINQQDFLAREAQAASPSCHWLRDPEQTGFLLEDEVVGFADFNFHVADVQASMRARSGLAPQPHPPGTFWYHPHCHGATHLQVASGMAGFLIIEGDVDEAINLALTGTRNPDPQVKTGTYDYIERTMLIQRVFNVSQDPDALAHTLQTAELAPGAHAQSHDGGTPYPAVNGDRIPTTITMRPGAIERWRVLNGSVDGQGQIRFMVLKGHYALEQRQPFEDEAAASVFGQVPAPTLVKLRDAATNTFTPATGTEMEADKQQLYLLAIDGITLVDVEGDEPVYAIRDLAAQNAGTENPLNRELTGHANPNIALQDNIQACFADAASIKNAFVRPNEVLFAQGNRADVFFRAPRMETTANQAAAGAIYTVLARLSVINSDDYLSALHEFGTKRDTLVAAVGGDTVVAYVVVSEGAHADGTTPAPIPDFNILDLNKVMPPVAEYHLPITEDDVRFKTAAVDTPADPDAADRLFGLGRRPFPLDHHCRRQRDRQELPGVRRARPGQWRQIGIAALRGDRQQRRVSPDDAGHRHHGNLNVALARRHR
jgi:FtsP/CotA-like multicopper oxidase with cupredoxin domain